MVQGFYTLDEAAQVLGMAPEDLNRMAQKREIRAFADRGTWRFRTQDVEELARRRGAAEPAPELSASPPPSSARRSKVVVTPPPKPAAPAADDDEIFGFSLTPDENVEIGQEMFAETSSKSGKSGKTGKTPPPQPNDEGLIGLAPPDSDLSRAASSDSFDLDLDDVKLADDPLPASPSGSKRKSGVKPADSNPSSSGKLAAKRRTALPPPPRQDDEVPLAPLPEDNDSDVRLDFDLDAKLKDDDSMVTVGDRLPKGPGDSDVRLDPAGDDVPANLEGIRTEEMIDLDAELRKADESAKKLKPSSGLKKPSKVKPQTKAPDLPTVSPFELSESDLEMTHSDEDDLAGSQVDSGSDFDLVLPTEDSDSMQLEIKSDDDEVGLGDLPPSSDVTSGVGRSGVNLQHPSDSGISLERENAQTDEVDFDLTLDADNSLSGPRTGPHGGASADVGSDSEFELALDEEGDLGAGAASAAGEEKDIFETDFDLPALEEESGSQAVALSESDTDLESSDFDLALDEGDLPAVEESGSQVVVLGDEEEPGDGPPTTARKRGLAEPVSEAESSDSFDLLGGDEDFGSIEREAEEEETESEPEMAGAAAAPPADWGMLPAMLMMPCVLVMVVVGLMSYELLHSMWGYHQPVKPTSMVVKSLAGLFTDDLKD